MLLKWPRFPTIYEINTYVWLSDLSRRIGAYVELDTIPPGEWDAIAELGFDAVWLMGVWERSPAGIAVANRNRQLLADFRRALPDYHPSDNVGSPYCVRRYVVDELLGGPKGLASARQELAQRGVRLILDFVPNHVAPDHSWVAEHPEYFIRGSADDARNDPASYVATDAGVLACGRDPFFPAWPDVVQLNAFEPTLRQATIDTVSRIAAQCDGIRCDMAMLMMNDIFERTWGARAGRRPASEYWVDVMPPVKGAYPNFLFIAEAYWDKEWELQHQGFDFCYDKRLYDRLEHDNAESIRLHLCADLAYQEKLLRFIENHDEPRAAGIFTPAKERAAAIVMATIPGAKLFQEGQFEGRKTRLPVFLGRRPLERVDSDLSTFYEKLLKNIDTPAFGDGEWSLCERTGWPDNTSYQNILAWFWEKDDERWLIVLNMSENPAQATVRIPCELARESWRLTDPLTGAAYDRDGDQVQHAGLYVDLGPWGCHFLQWHRTHQTLIAISCSGIECIRL